MSTRPRRDSRSASRAAAVTRLVEGVEALPGDRGLERVGQHPERDEHVAQVRRAQERLAPGAGRAAARSLGRLVPCPAVLARTARAPRAIRSSTGVVGRLEAEHEQRARAVAGARQRRLARVDQPAVGRLQPRLRRRPAPPRAPAAKSAKRTARAGACARRGCTRTHASVITPRIPSRAEQQPVGRRAGAGARQPPRLPHAGRRDRADRLDEVVDVRLSPSRSARRRASRSSRRASRARTTAGSSAASARARASCSSSAGPSAPAWMRAARETASTSSTRSSAPRSSVTAPANACRDARLDAADDARAAAERDDRRADVGRPFEHALDVGLVARARDDVGRVVDPPAERAHDVAVGAAVRVPHALVAVARADRRERAWRRRQPRGRQLDRRQLDRPLRIGRAEAEVLRQPAGRLPHLLVRERLVRQPPAPVVACAAAHRAQATRPARAESRFALRATYPLAMSSTHGLLLARGPWSPAQVTAAGARSRSSRRGRHRGGRRGDRRAARARLAEPRRPRRAAGRLRAARRRAATRAAADALGAAAGRRRRGARCRALCVVRDHRRPLAGRPPRARGWRPGPAAGRSARAARSTSARTRPTRWRASCARSGRVAPERLSVEALCAAAPARDAHRPGLAARRAPWSCRDHEHDAYAWWPADVERLAGRGRRAAAADGRDAGLMHVSFPFRTLKHLSFTALGDLHVPADRLARARAAQPRSSSSGWCARPRLDRHVAALPRRGARAGIDPALARRRRSPWSAASGRSRAASGS